MGINESTQEVSLEVFSINCLYQPREPITYNLLWVSVKNTVTLGKYYIYNIINQGDTICFNLQDGFLSCSYILLMFAPSWAFSKQHIPWMSFFFMINILPVGLKKTFHLSIYLWMFCCVNLVVSHYGLTDLSFILVNLKSDTCSKVYTQPKRKYLVVLQKIKTFASTMELTWKHYQVLIVLVVFAIVTSL